ncbi:MAG: sensor histidine kinase N-terminal domain-containing protein [Phycisphaerales bacterium]|nr:sensor histidine kinase N-terminal domain-containing protein [Phycisphaerales bacterium]
MKSLRARLALGTIVGLIAALGIGGAALDQTLRGVLHTDSDRALLAQARALAALVELDDEGLEFTPPNARFTATAPSDFEVAPREYYELWSPTGDVLARSATLGAEDLPRPAPASATARYENTTINGRAVRVVVLTFAPRIDDAGDVVAEETPITLALAKDMAPLAATLANVRNALLAVGAATLLLAGLALVWAGRLAVRPVEIVAAHIAAIRETSLPAKIDAASVPAELQPVINRLNGLLERLRAAFERERRFTGDAAHELRTPLAALRARLEVTLSRKREADDYVLAMNECLAVTTRLARLVEMLLDLTRADAGAIAASSETIDCVRLAQSAWDSLQEPATRRSMSIRWTGAAALVQADRIALSAILINLLENAIRHGRGGSTIEVDVGAKRGWVHVTVANPADLPPDALPRVFERFWRADASWQSGVDDAGFGLGLPLSKALAERMGATIEAAYHEGVFSVTLTLPAVDGNDGRAPANTTPASVDNTLGVAATPKA